VFLDAFPNLLTIPSLRRPLQVGLPPLQHEASSSRSSPRRCHRFQSKGVAPRRRNCGRVLSQRRGLRGLQVSHFEDGANDFQ